MMNDEVLLLTLKGGHKMAEWLKSCCNGVLDSVSEIAGFRGQGPIDLENGVRGAAKDMTSAVVAAGLLLLISALQPDPQDSK
jgi:hypothetical protein